MHLSWILLPLTGLSPYVSDSGAKSGITLLQDIVFLVSGVNEADFKTLQATTCERLRDIGELVDKNEHTRIFNDQGISSAVRCSEECHKIIKDVRNVLRKGGWQPKKPGLAKDDIDISLFSSLRWPFLKWSLEVPRAELQRIKIDLSLLFSSAMALGA